MNKKKTDLFHDYGARAWAAGMEAFVCMVRGVEWHTETKDECELLAQ